MATKPEGAEHRPEECDFCRSDAELASLTGGTVADKTYTEDEYNALSAQVEELQAKVAELTAAAGDAELDARVAAVKAELDEQVADLQSKLDTATLEAETAKKSHEDLVAFLAAEQAAKEEAEALAARKDERVAQVKEVASAFSDEYIAEHADRWAGMSDEAFTATLEDFKAIADKAPATKTDGDDEIPAETAMTAAATTKTKNDSLSAVTEVLGLRFAGSTVKSI